MITMHEAKICIYYDGECPRCIRDRDHYLALAGDKGKDLEWFNISGKEQQLKQMGINPQKALTELHISIEDPVAHTTTIVSELEAYIILMQRVNRLKPLAFILGLPLIRPILAKFYHYSVIKRLKKTHRLP